MSMDILSRLRSAPKGDKTSHAAADEIDRLRAELAASREREAELQLILSRVAGWDHRGSALWEEYERHYSEPWPCPPDDIGALAEGAQG